MSARDIARTVSSVLLFACVSLSCKDQNNPLTGESPSDVVFPARDVSYGYQVQPLFNQACALSGCHDDAVAQDRLKLTSWGHTRLDFVGVVVPGQPDQSGLVLRIQGSVGTRMPPYGNPLNQNQINGIRTWIAEGANNN